MFNPKEDIIEFVLTSHGKELLANGEFKPVYYSFSDEDIIYDYEVAGVSENSSNIMERMLDNTPYLNPQASFASVDNMSATLNQNQYDRDYKQVLCLGTSEPGNEYAPAWNARMYSGKITGTYLEITGTANVKIPQVVLAPQNFQVSVIDNLPESVYSQVQLEGIEPGIVGNYQRFDDGRFIEVVPQDIFIELSEINSIFKDDNFSMEIYVYDGSGSTETLKPLYFSHQNNEREDIYNEDEYFTIFPTSADEDNVEKFFNIEVDSEIPNYIICKYVPQDRRQGIYANYVECQDDRTFVLNLDEGIEDEDC